VDSEGHVKTIADALAYLEQVTGFDMQNASKPLMPQSEDYYRVKIIEIRKRL